jgi:uncharacterized membrane protein
MIGLGDIPGGEFRSRAFGVSGDGSVVVGFGMSPGFLAFRWTTGGGIGYLGDFANGDRTLIAWDVSADGSVIVGLGRRLSENA